MVELLTSLLEVLLILAIVAGVYLVGGPGPALIAGGCLGLAYMFVESRGGL